MGLKLAVTKPSGLSMPNAYHRITGCTISGPVTAPIICVYVDKAARDAGNPPEYSITAESIPFDHSASGTTLELQYAALKAFVDPDGKIDYRNAEDVFEAGQP